MLPTVGSPLLWAGFLALVTVLLCLDLFVFHRKVHDVSPREALGFSVFWVALSLAFNAWVGHRFGSVRGLEFLAGYLIEKALSVDNLFVFLLVFSTFGVPPRYQHRILFWGVFGALVMRAIFIFAGAALLARFHWAIYLFGAFLVYTGGKILLSKGTEVHPERNPLLKLFSRFVPTMAGFHGGAFFVKSFGKRYATSMVPVLLVVEATDVVFAVDSIPAIFGVTRDPFIVFTSNVFAILGLRSLYFLLASAMDRFHLLKYGLGAVLLFVGGKMVAGAWVEVPVTLSLGVVAFLLFASVTASLLVPPPETLLPGAPHDREDEGEGGSPRGDGGKM
jgi:tellurite resistance protein TerC